MASSTAVEASLATVAPSAPGMSDARRAADALVAAGVGRVLLYGSVARGQGCEHSDIDLVAIYDDLGDYRGRRGRRCDLERRAGDAAGHRVDVMVTDAPEWAVRTTKVPCSVEARIASYAVELAEAGHRQDIDWDKEIGLPADPTAELQHRLTDMTNAVAALTDWLRPTARESAAAEDGDRDELAFHEDRRWMRAMGEVHMVIECAAKATHVAALGKAAPYDHRIDVLIDSQPIAVRGAFRDAAQDSGIDLGALHVWRSAAAYSADLPEEHFDEESLRAHATAALQIAAHAADHCRGHDLPEVALDRHGREITALRAALDQPIRCPR
ncbi:nucleotidyltransferase domain-containing protein [Candidatus Poriferisodalis sp.]|uniref:nucleotidyltransferase domain-containing protein n=1 Tax=Candidatus Poriferisodalis sp. TaxID=3101277 RepID=UPI003B02C066